VKWIAGVLMLACGVAVGAQEPIVQPQVRPGTIYASPMDSRPPRPTPEGVRLKVDGKAAAANLINRVDAVYPPLARQTRISGTVRLHAVIGKDGAVRQLEVISGHPLLVQSALDAVRKWKYQPTHLNGKLVEVDTTIDVIYELNEDTSQNPPKLMGLAPKSVDPALRADVLALLEENHVSRASETVMRKMFDGMRPMMLKSFAGLENREKILDSYENKLVAMTYTEEFREGIVAVYAKYFNDDDVKNLMAFYSTPTGEKFNESMPQLSADLMGVGQRLAQEKLPDIFKELCREYPELGGKLPQCPAADQDKKSDLALPEAVFSSSAE
jgi:TonB family protein